MMLGVNIDHVATLRQARRGITPDPVAAAAVCEKAGCDSIVAHLREDRRHMNDNDISILRKAVKTKFNLEMSINKDIVKVALDIKPDQATLVPEKREEVTTEGGLDVFSNMDEISRTVEKLQSNNIRVSLFVDPEKGQIEASGKTGAEMIEIHTGRYANAQGMAEAEKRLSEIKEAARIGCDIGLTVNAGHGLDYDNVRAVARIEGLEELNIGHSIISYAVFAGLENAIKDMLALLR